MLSREDIEGFKAKYTQTRDKFIANVNVMQGAINSMDALLDLWSQKERALGEDDGEDKELANGRSEG